jgi:hypothetical protein
MENVFLETPGSVIVPAAHFPVRKVQLAPTTCMLLPERPANRFAGRFPVPESAFDQKISGKSGSPKISR